MVASMVGSVIGSVGTGTDVAGSAMTGSGVATDVGGDPAHAEINMDINIIQQKIVLFMPGPLVPLLRIA